MSSQPTGGAQLARPRRASRMPNRLGDENSVSTGLVTAAAGGGPRLMSKASITSLSSKARVAAKPVVSATAASGKSVSTTAIATAAAAIAPRRAFGDVSNNNARVVVAADRSSKDFLALGVTKQPRSRSTSANSATSTTSQPAQPPSSTGTGFSRLKITHATKTSSSSTSTTTTTSTNTNVRGPLQNKQVGGVPVGVKGINGPFRGEEWKSSVEEEEEEEEEEGEDEQEKEEMDLIHEEHAMAGLGIMSEDLAMPSVVPRPSTSSHKRGHDSESNSSQGEVDAVGSKVRILEDQHEQQQLSVDPDDWLALLGVGTGNMKMNDDEKVLATIKSEFEEQLDYWDTTMVAEYSDEIFAYMGELESKAMPNPRYMDYQTEIEWSMRTTLIDWLLQVHMRYHMLPETLWIAINIVDRFLSNRVVTLIKFQLVGVTAMFIAAKYEEIMAPSVDEFVYMTEGGYKKEEILKGERIILQSLDFNISRYCSPYSWVRRISKADDYDIQTRTLSKYLMEVTLLDHRFLRAKPSMIAAIGMYLARKMLGGDWNESFIYYSNYTEAQLSVPAAFLLEMISHADFEQKFVYKKYANKKFLKAAQFAKTWAAQHTLN